MIFLALYLLIQWLHTLTCHSSIKPRSFSLRSTKLLPPKFLMCISPLSDFSHFFWMTSIINLTTPTLSLCTWLLILLFSCIHISLFSCIWNLNSLTRNKLKSIQWIHSQFLFSLSFILLETRLCDYGSPSTWFKPHPSPRSVQPYLRKRTVYRGCVPVYGQNTDSPALLRQETTCWGHLSKYKHLSIKKIQFLINWFIIYPFSIYAAPWNMCYPPAELLASWSKGVCSGTSLEANSSQSPWALKLSLSLFPIAPLPKGVWGFDYPWVSSYSLGSG